MEILTLLFWAMIGSVFSLLGGLLMISRKSWRKTAVRLGLPFGAGALLAAAFIGVLPEAMHTMDYHVALIFTLLGFLVFFILERFLGWFHHHEHHHHESVDGPKNNTSHQWLVIIGDTAHNAIDGVAIGAAFLVNPAAGIGTALAVAAHEIPQEIGDFSILLGKGMRPRNVIIVNLLSALATVVTALGTYILGASFSIDPAPLLAVAAGFFIYVAASDIIPEIHERPRPEANRQALILLIGVALIAAVVWSMPHSHSHDEQLDCLSQATLNAMGAPPPGESLPPACEDVHHHSSDSEHDHDH